MRTADAIGLVIFDCDGVLVDSERLAVKVEASLLAELGWPLSEAEVIERFTGRSPQAMFAEIAKRLGDTLPRSWQDQFDARYRQVFETDLAVVDGLPEALDQIYLPNCVASSSTPEQLQYKLQLTGLYERFRGRTFSASQVKNGKPAPDLFLHAARQLDVPPGQCVVVEDSLYGVQAGREAGMRVLAFAGGLIAPELLEGPATTVFRHMRDLPTLLNAELSNEERGGAPQFGSAR